MRIDLFLKVARVVKRRSQAKELCDEGVVKVNGKVVKSSKEVHEGDTVEINSVFRHIKFTIRAVPERKSVSKSEARKLIDVEIDERRKLKDIIDLV